jgi:hypothetical protein
MFDGWMLSADSLNRSQNNSDKTHSLGNSVCNDALSAALNNSGRSATQHRNREQSCHLMTSDRRKRLGQIQAHSSIETIRSDRRGAIAIPDS